MEQDNRRNSLTSSPSRTLSTTTTDSSRTRLARLLAILAKWRIVKGWSAAAGEQNIAQAAVYLEVLDRHRVPAEHYETLYRRFIDGRARSMAMGSKADDLSPEALVALWNGQNGLASEIREKAAKPDLPDCGLCNNSGWETVTRGCYRGVKECGCGRVRR